MNMGMEYIRSSISLNSFHCAIIARWDDMPHEGRSIPVRIIKKKVTWSPPGDKESFSGLLTDLHRFLSVRRSEPNCPDCTEYGVWSYSHDSYCCKGE